MGAGLLPVLSPPQEIPGPVQIPRLPRPQQGSFSVKLPDGRVQHPKQGSYSVNLPDGRVQHVNYRVDPVKGFVITGVWYDQPAIIHAAPWANGPMPRKMEWENGEEQ